MTTLARSPARPINCGRWSTFATCMALAVLLDVVYNHAGGWGSGANFDDRGLFFLDREATGDDNRSQYFTDQGWAGGLVFAYGKDAVRQFLIDNAASFLDEYHADGFRYDEVTVIDEFGGWSFCQDLTDTLLLPRPDAIHVAEYWKDDPSPGHQADRRRGRGVRRRSGMPACEGRPRAHRPGRRRAGRRRSASRRSATHWPIPRASRQHGGACSTSRITTSSTNPTATRCRGFRPWPTAPIPDRGTPAAVRRRGDGPPPDGPGHPDAVHGPGVPGVEILERLAGRRRP